ncbi:MAG: hypothetical protein IH585_10425 [Anaerolineaceae bacterium]|nr:hypothetical protein [Anaerolineaceae bacterium]
MGKDNKKNHHLGVYLGKSSVAEGINAIKFLSNGNNHPDTQEKFSVLVVPHTHADLCWPEIPDYCIDACMACIDDLLRFQQLSPGFRFSMEHAFYLRIYLERNPESTEKIIDLIRRGFFECGAFYLGPTELTAGGESLIRELYLGKRWLKEKFNIDAKVVWNVDCPGHTMQLPQILTRAGVPYFVIWKEFNLFEHDYSGYNGPCFFRWAAPDKSEVVTCFTPGGYGIGRQLGFREPFNVLMDRLPGFLNDVAGHLNHYQLPKVILIADGTDIERPTLDVTKNIKQWNEKFNHPKMELVTTEEFFERIDRTSLPQINGESPNWWDTIGSFQNERVMGERQLEPRQAAAEAFSAVVSILNSSYEHPNSLLEKIWENRLFANEHNSGGRNGNISDAVKLTKIKSARVLVDNVLNQSLAEIALNVNFQQTGIPVLVFNSILWTRKNVIEIELHFRRGEFNSIKIVDRHGTEIPYQEKSLTCYDDNSIKDCVLLVCMKLPALGYETLYVINEKPQEITNQIFSRVNKHTYENQWFVFSVDPVSGYLVSIKNKLNGEELLSCSEFHFGELVTVENTAHDEDEHLTGKYWRSSQYRSKAWLSENGPIRAVWTVEGDFKGCFRRQNFIFYRDLQRFDIESEIEWHGEKDLQLMQSFPFVFNNETKLDYGVPFGHSRYLAENPSWTKIHPSIRGVRDWLHVGGKQAGITLASEVIPFEFRNRIKSINQEMLVQPILIKTTYSCHDHLEFLRKLNLDTINIQAKETGTKAIRPDNPEVRWDQTGKHIYKFSVMIDSGSFDPVASSRFGIEFQTPFFYFIHYENLDQFPHLQMEQVKSRLSNLDRNLPESICFIACESMNVIPTWVKKAEDGEGIIVRCYEAGGLQGKTTFETFLPLTEAYETDIIEYDINRLEIVNGRLATDLEPYKIETVRIKF